MNSKPAPHPLRLDELDGLRGLLALWVAVSHMICMCGLSDLSLPASLEHGWLEFVFAEPAVECFMILSGFAISFLIANRPQKYGSFLTGRFFRLYPVYAVCLLIAITSLPLRHFVLSAPAWQSGQYYQWMTGHLANSELNFGKHLLWHIPMLHGLPTVTLLPDSTSAFLGPAWSVSLEWQYYLVAPLIALCVRSTRGIFLLAVIAWLGLRFAPAWENAHLAFLPPQLPLFLIGIGSFHVYAWFRKLPAESARAGNLLVAGCITAAVLLHWHRTAIVVWAVVFGSVLASGTDPMTRVLSYLRTFLLLRPLQRLGQISYSLYLIHLPLIFLLLYGLFRWRPNIPALHALWVMLLVGLPVIFVSTDLLHRFVELPGMRLGKKLTHAGSHRAD